MVHKTEEIMEHLLDCDPAIGYLTETWLTSDNNHVTALVTSYGYTLLNNRRKDRPKETGGGVGLLIESNVVKKQLSSRMYSSFELTMVRITLLTKNSLILIFVYRLLFIPITVFLEEITQLLEMTITSYDVVILAGGVNIHMETNDLYARQMRDILDMFNMVQHITVPTHKMGHTLDIVATFINNPIVTDIDVSEYDLNHHFLIDFKIPCAPETCVQNC